MKAPLFAVLITFVSIDLVRAETDKPFVLYATGDARPYVWFEESIGFTGSDYEIVAEAFARAGYSLEVRRAPYKRIVEDMMHGRILGMFPAAEMSHRDRYVYTLPLPLHELVYKVFVRVGEEFDYREVSSLYGKNVGVMRGADFPSLTEAVAAEKIRLSEHNGKEAMVKMLAMGRIDVLLGSPAVLNPIIDELEMNEMLVSLPVPFYQISVHLCLAKEFPDSSPEMVENLTRAMAAMEIDGTVTAIRQGYRE